MHQPRILDFKLKIVNEWDFTLYPSGEGGFLLSRKKGGKKEVSRKKGGKLPEIGYFFFFEDLCI